MRHPRMLAAATIGLAACATIPEPGGGGENLPSAGAGPFRALVQAELGNLRVAPNALDTDAFARDPSVVDLDGDPGTLAVAGYFGAAVAQGDTKPVATDPTRAILRFGALDGRSFDRAAEVVLEPTEAWEGGVLGQPSALLHDDGETWLYYAAAGGIGLAKSGDGHTFTRVAGPILGPAASGWEASGIPASPGVVRLPDGSFRLFYEVTIAKDVQAIGEASSSDGVTWTRLGTAPALAPSAPRAGVDQPYDDASVGSPFPVLATSGDGRAILRVYYGASDQLGSAVIGLAARYLDAPSAKLQRATAPVFGTTKPLSPREPCVLAFPGFTLLFATEKSASNAAHPAVAVAAAPALAALPPPDPQ
jgi:hypothetical protein